MDTTKAFDAVYTLYKHWRSTCEQQARDDTERSRRDRRDAFIQLDGAESVYLALTGLDYMTLNDMEFNRWWDDYMREHRAS